MISLLFIWFAMACSVFFPILFLIMIVDAIKEWKEKLDFHKKVLEAAETMKTAPVRFNEEKLREDPIYQAAFIWMLQHPNDYSETDLEFLKRQPALINIYILALRKGWIMS